MSFYGNMFLEFKKFFYNFKAQGSKDVQLIQDTDSTLLGDQSKVFTPQSDHASLTLASGNRWIQMQPIDSKAVDEEGRKIYDGITLYHAPPGGIDQETKISQGIKKYDTSQGILDPSAYTELLSGDIIETSKDIYDEAGHMWKQEPVYLKLPKTEFESDLEVMKKDIEDFKRLDLPQVKSDGERLRTDLGELYEVFPGDMATPENLKSVMDIIGPVYSSSSTQQTISSHVAQLTGKDNKPISIEQAFSSIVEYCQALEKTNATYELAIAQLKTQNEALDSRIKALETK